ncbi:MAG: glycosyltransferase family 2 protein [Gammaproteobacteria bacterium]
MALPSVTIITTVLNEKAGLQRTIESIQQLNYPNLEYVIIDGGSTDGTIELIEKSSIVSRWISGQDAGIADAFNKGLKLATGDYINFQGAGDYFIQPDVIAKLMDDVNPSEVDLVCGKVQRVTEDNQPLWIAPKRFGVEFDKKSLLFKMSLPHQGLFTHRRFFGKFGGFDVACKFAMDYELLLRAYHDFPKVMTKDLLVAAWRAGGVGTGRLQQIFDEYHAIKLKHQVATPLLLKCIDKWTRFKASMREYLGVRT